MDTIVLGCFVSRTGLRAVRRRYELLSNSAREDLNDLIPVQGRRYTKTAAFAHEVFQKGVRKRFSQTVGIHL